jgi:hypothetical protein
VFGISALAASWVFGRALSGSVAVSVASEALRDVELRGVPFCVVMATFDNDSLIDAIVSLIRAFGKDDDGVMQRCFVSFCSSPEREDLDDVEVGALIFFLELDDVVLVGVPGVKIKLGDSVDNDSILPFA